MKTYSVEHWGEVVPLASPEGNEKMTVYELRNFAVRGLRESRDNPLALMLADSLELRWDSAAEDAHDLIRAHIANCLACLRAFHGVVHNRTDYLLLALCQGPTWPEYEQDIAQATKRLTT